MKRYIGLLILTLLVYNTFLTAQNSNNEQKTGDLTVIITGCDNNEGNVQIALYNSEESYSSKQDETVFKSETIPVENRGVTWIVKNISFGDYAIKTFHDENSDSLINKNLLGIPTESYGFSNNAKARFAQPAFSKAKFLFNPEEAQVEIRLR